MYTGLLRTLIIASVVAVPTLSAQVRHSGSPQALRHGLDPAIPTVEATAPDAAVLRQQDLLAPSSPLRYGVPVPVGLDVIARGAYDVTEDDRLVVRARVAVAGAYSLGLEFDRFRLPPTGQLFLYDDTMTHVFGAYTAANQGPDGQFVIEPFPGDSVIIEYSQSAGASHVGEVVIGDVIYDYKDVHRILRDDYTPYKSGGGDAEGCSMVDVSCPEGDPYPNQKRSTVRTASNGFLCSGVLINNTANDGTRYVYTANHCGQTNLTVFVFNYERPSCGTGVGSLAQSVSGAAVLASDVDTDGRLLRINNQIPNSFNPYFSGWSRSTSNLTFAMSMHHPDGKEKKISIDNDGGAAITAVVNGIGSVKAWNIDFQVGGTMVGSSGGPLFDNNNRVRGTLTGGPADCSKAFYGRFHEFWSDASIGAFLDPTGTGQQDLDGFDPVPPPGPPVINTISPTSVTAFQPGTVTLNGDGFMNVTQVTVGSKVLTLPNGFEIMSDTQLRFSAPAPPSLGSLPVTATNNLGTSQPIQLTYTQTPTLTYFAEPLLFNGFSQVFEWGGEPNQITFLSAALANNTVPFQGQAYLVPVYVAQLANTDAAGLGRIVVPLNGLTFGIQIYTQILTVAPPATDPSTVELSNIESSLVVN